MGLFLDEDRKRIDAAGERNERDVKAESSFLEGSSISRLID